MTTSGRTDVPAGTDRPSVVLVRPWADDDAETSCCGGRVRDAVCLGDDADHRHPATETTDPVADLYRRVRSAVPDADIQIVSSTNAAYLVPWSYRAARRQGRGAWRSLRQALDATRAAAVIVDGEVVGDIEADAPDRLVARVMATVGPATPSDGSARAE